MTKQLRHALPLLIGCLFLVCYLVCAENTVTADKGDKALSYVTDYGGIDYAPVYDYNYYIKRHPNLVEKYNSNKKMILGHYVKNGYPKIEKGRKGATEEDFAKVQEARIAKFLKNSAVGKKTSQIIVVCDHELSLWNRKKDGSWTRKLCCYCGYGKNGMSSDRHAGDKTTPIGAFPILHAFGNFANPGTKMTWKDITPYSYWSAEYDTYNTWVESRSSMSGEHLADYYQYAYAMAIGFNIDPVVYGKGSAIFLHCKSKGRWWTSGCVSVKKSIMKKLLKLCRNGTYIIIVPEDIDIKKL